MFCLKLTEFEPSKKHYSPHILNTLHLCCIQRIICTILSSIFSQIFIHLVVTSVCYLAFRFGFDYCTCTSMQDNTAHKCTIHLLYHGNFKKLLSKNISVLLAKVSFLQFRTILDQEDNLYGTICYSTFVHHLCSCLTEVFPVLQGY